MNQWQDVKKTKAYLLVVFFGMHYVFLQDYRFTKFIRAFHIRVLWNLLLPLDLF